MAMYLPLLAHQYQRFSEREGPGIEVRLDNDPLNEHCILMGALTIRRTGGGGGFGKFYAVLCFLYSIIYATTLKFMLIFCHARMKHSMVKSNYCKME